MKSYSIYEIECIVSGRKYVGASKEFKTRRGAHRNSLRKGIHHSPLLQKEWSEFGENSFLFREIETGLSREDAMNRELLHINSGKYAYNGISCSYLKDGTPHFGSDNPMFGKKHSAESKNAISSSLRRQYEVGELTGLVRLGESNPNFRHGKQSRNADLKCSHCGCRIASKAALNSGMCIKCNKVGHNNPFYGKKHSKESVDKIIASNALIRANPKYTTPQMRKVTDGVTVYKSLSEMAEALGVVCGTVFHRINSPKERWKNYRYID
jgi:group I intron endonuclease